VTTAIPFETRFAPLPERPQPRLPESPYRGLVPFTEQDTDFFFGRDADRKLIAANLRTSRLTILYGASGVGKSSLLRAGVIPDLRDQIRANVEDRGRPRFVVAAFSAWREKELIPAVCQEVRAAVLEVAPDFEPHEPEGLPELLDAACKWIEGKVLIAFDQFDEYFVYHALDEGEGSFASQLAEAVNAPGLRANVLLSIREDALAKLDRFQGEIPSLFDNYLRLNHLDPNGARDAIVKPVEKYNELAGDGKMTVELALVNALLDELEAGRVLVGLVGVGVAAGVREEERPDEVKRVETPYLQLVMTRLWNEEIRRGSSMVRLVTLDRLGHAERIVKRHLDQTMRSLPRYKRYVAARVFHHLVTPSGTKIAHTAVDLAAYVGLAPKAVEPVLEKLTGPNFRILRCITAADSEETPPRFEIFHDVLAPAILDWRARYLRTREVFQRVRRGATGVLHVLVGWGLVAAAIAASVSAPGAWRWPAAVWGIGAVVTWIGATVVLAKRWRRRTAWLLPISGFVASVLWPVTMTIAVATFAFRRRGLLVPRRWQPVARSRR
jgi:hypothetical protein